MDEELEYVETSDIEELEEWNESIRISRTRSPSPGNGSVVHPPLKKIKLFHDEDASAVALPCTPVRRIQNESIPQTPEMRIPSQTPSLSQSSATVTIDHPTSQTHVADSPEAKGVGPFVDEAHEEARTAVPFDHPQDPLLLDGPVRRVLNASTPPQSPYLVDLPSPFLPRTTPPCTPMKARKVDIDTHFAEVAPSIAFDTPGRPLAITPQVTEFVRTADDDNDILMDDAGPGIESLFSSPAKSVRDGAVRSPDAFPGLSPRSIGASSPASRSRSASPPPSPSERSSVPAEDSHGSDEQRDEELEQPDTPEEPPVIPPEKPYALRTRTVLQQKPYTVLDGQYLRQTKGFKEARVKVRSPSRGHRRHSEGRDGAEGDEEDRGFIVDEDEELSDGEAGRKRRRRTLDRDDVTGEHEGAGRNKRKRGVVDDAARDQTGDAYEDEEDASEKRTQTALEIMLDAIDDEPEDREERRKRMRELKKARRKEKEQRQAVRNRTNFSRSDNTMHEVVETSCQPDGLSTSAADGIPTIHGQERTIKDEHVAGSRPAARLKRKQDETISISSDSDVEVVSRPRSPLTPSHGLSPPASRPISPTTAYHSSSDSDSDPGSNLEVAGKVIDVESLHKIYPPGLVRKLLQQASERPQESRRLELPRTEGNGPLLPGQTRVRRRKVIVQREIKGDSESELDMPENDDSHRTPSPSPTRRQSPGLVQRPARRDKRVSNPESGVSEEEKGEYESDIDSDVEVLDDIAIKSLTARQKKATTSDRPRTEATLIDYMLSKTIRFNLKSGVGKQKKKNGVPSKPKLDISIAGARGDKQALLENFQGYGRNRGEGSQRHGRQSSATGRSVTPTVHVSDEDDVSSDSEDSVEENQHGSTRRQGAKRTKPRLRDLYILKPPGGGKAIIVSGAQREMVTVDVEVEAPSDGAVHPQPKIRQWEGETYRRVRPPDRRLPLGSKQGRTVEQSTATTPEHLEVGQRSSAPPETEVELEESQGARYPFFRESGVPRLPSGIAFASGTYINKGWLWELCCCINPSSDSSPSPAVHFLQEFDIPVEAPVHEIAQVVNKSLQGIFDFINDPPEAILEPNLDEQRTIDHWTTISRNLCKGVSYCLSKRSDGDRSSLIDHVGNAVRVLVARIEGLRLPRRSLDIRVFLANWTAIELSARIGEPMTENARLAGSILTDSIQLLVNQLLFFGLDSTMKPVIRGLEAEALSKYSLPSHTAELWVRLIHLCCEYDKRETMKHNHVFWQFVQASFKASLDAMTPDVGVYEDLWHSIFSLCAISQFTAHGMVRDQTNLPGCWELVRFICHEAFNPDGSEPVNHNAYVGLLLARFLVLNERWKWKVVDVSSLVKLVVDTVFHPIKFGNLEGEKPDFPDFLRKPDKSDLSSWASSDPAYVLLLKFIFKAAQEPTVKETSIKKLLSLADPAASIQIDRNRPLRVGDMDRVINRLTAAIVAVRLVPTKEHYASKVEQIRSTMFFANANNVTRMTLIRGLKYWSEFILKHQPELGIHPLAPWLGDMADTLAKRWRKRKKRDGVKPADDSRLSIQARSLLGTVRDVCMLSPVPEIDFLAQVKQFIVVTLEEEEIQRSARFILEIIIDRWYRVHPPLRPLPPQQDQEESQDLYGDGFDDINWDAADIPEELGVPPTASQGQDQTDKSLRALKDAIDDRLQWFLFRSFKDCFNTRRITLGCDFISAWVGCKLLGIQGESIEGEIDAMRRLVSPPEEESSGSISKIFDTAFALAILQRHPMAYKMAHFADLFLGALMLSLTYPPSVFNLSTAYVRTFLSVDYLQHPLLRDCQSVPPPSGSPPVYDLATKDFPQIRIEMLDTILSNLNHLIEAGDTNGDHFAGIVAESFSTMRQILINPKSRVSRSRAKYAAFCKEVMGLLLKNTTLAERPRMQFWAKWTP